jgi:hypothetical protein
MAEPFGIENILEEPIVPDVPVVVVVQPTEAPGKARKIKNFLI